MKVRSPKISLGPILYYWERETVFDFYRKIADSAVDIVYLGETVCSKRRLLREQDWLTIAEQLRDAGKQVVLSTLTLIESGAELSKLQSLCKHKDSMIEANDMAAVNQLAGQQPFVTGPSVNVYNQQTLQFLAGLGLKRWVLPVELGRDALASLQAQRPENIETEVFVYGRLPLAYSARCFTARSHNLAKDDCGFSCLYDPDGMLLSTRENEPFLVLNGIQTQSARSCNLINELGELISLGVDVLRISPQSQHTPEIIKLFHDCIDGNLSIDDAGQSLNALAPTGCCNGYWYGEAGMDAHEEIKKLHEYAQGRSFFL